MAETLPLGTTATGELRVPSDPHAVVVVAHPDPACDKIIRDTLHDARFATLQIDLGGGLPAGSETVRRLTEQLLTMTGWLRARSALATIPVGIFGSEIGGAAALAAAAARPNVVRALVLRDGRPHLAGSVLNEVRAATLLIVDGQDNEAMAMNQETMTRVKGIAELEILARDDPETIAQVAQLARRWFGRFLA